MENKTELLIECKNQLEYLNEKFGETGTTNSLLAKLERDINTPSPTMDEVVDAVVNGIFIRGIELEDYRREVAGVYKALCELFSVEPNYSQIKIEERNFHVPLWVIRKKCGWEKFCDVTGTNEWSLNEGLADDDTIFTVTESQGEKLGLL